MKPSEEAVPVVSAHVSIMEMAKALDEFGCVILSRVVEGPALHRAQEAALALVRAAPFGTNPLDGFRTRRIFDPMAQTRELDQLATHELIQGLVAQRLRWPYQFGWTVLSLIESGEKTQRAHRDASAYPLPAHFPEFMLNTIWALDDFTPDNGGTLVSLRSHRRGSEAKGMVPVVMGAGSVLVYCGRLLHGGGPNTSAGTRCGLILEYVARWLRPGQSHTLSVDPQIARALPMNVAELLGYNQANRHVGFVGDVPIPTWLRNDGIEP